VMPRNEIVEERYRDEGEGVHVDEDLQEGRVRSG
jgi:hypothetical protein